MTEPIKMGRTHEMTIEDCVEAGLSVALMDYNVTLSTARWDEICKRTGREIAMRLRRAGYEKKSLPSGDQADVL